MVSFNPFEIRNQRNIHHKHEGSPLLRSEELSDEEVTRLLFKTKPRRKIRYALLIKILISIVCCVALLAFAWILQYNTNSTTSFHYQPTEELRRPHFGPTLLSVIDADTQKFVYALNNTLYETMLRSTTVDYISIKDALKYIPQCRRASFCELPQLWLDKTTLSVHGSNDDNEIKDESLLLSWTLGRDGKNGKVLLKNDDVIALYCGTNKEFEHDDYREFLEAATISQAKTTSVHNGGAKLDNAWFLPRFPNLRQEHCHFRLYMVVTRGGGDDEGDHSASVRRFVHVASTESLRIEHAKETPTAIHLAYSHTPSTMMVQFTTGNWTTDSVIPAVPVVRYAEMSHGTKHDVHSIVTKRKSETSHDDTTFPDSESTLLLSEGTSETYSAADMCSDPANVAEAGKFYPPGLLHTVPVNHLKPSKSYQYQVGLSVNGSVAVWSSPSMFTTAPEGLEGNEESFSFIVYGDQGCPETGCEDGRKWLSAMVKREPNISSVHHFGDISYANGAAHIWDAWFRMIEPFSTKIPLMIAIGNHEYDHITGGEGKDPSGVRTSDGFQPSWGNFLINDSGGECGVPMAKRFRMPFSPKSNGVFWYSYDYGMVHTIVISSEHDLSMGSPQYDFLKHDLEHVNRTKTPWIILESHRPLYEGETGEHWIPNTIVGEAMRDEIEDLLFIHKVDVVLAGHYHEYHRTCNGLYREVCDSGGPVHITIGAAGAPLDDFYASITSYKNPWTAFYLPGVHGYGKIEGNKTSLHFTFVRHGDDDDHMAGQVLDSFYVYPRP